MKNRMFCETMQRFTNRVKNGTGYKIAFGTILAFFMFNTAVSAQTAPTLATAATTPSQHGPMKFHGLHPGGGIDSSNWSGYAVIGSKFTFAKGSGHVPEVNCDKTPNSFSYFWVGIDGYSDNTVEQTGTASDCNGTTPVYFAWYEFFPAGIQIIDLPISAGDVIGASVIYSGGQFTLGIHDHNTGQEFSVTLNAPGAQRSSAEWITESPTGVLADFDKSNYGFDNTGDEGTNRANDKSTSGPISDFGSNVVDITMVNSSGVVEAVPTALTKDGTSFTVDWKHE
jgi:hypothetical protein